jgi:hypothetical protein
VVLAAARLAGATAAYRVGGAQAVAALAYGTATVPAVDKIVGPGNIYVAFAKRLVFGDVGIDLVAGPSEVVVVADRTAEPTHVAADLLAQAEHDPLARAVCLTDDADLAGRVAAAVARQCPALPRAAIAEAAIRAHGAVVVTRDLAEALAIANRLAPEHLELAVADPFAWLSAVRHAGAIFLGVHTPEVVGDYLAGPTTSFPRALRRASRPACRWRTSSSARASSTTRRPGSGRRGPTSPRWRRRRGSTGTARRRESAWTAPDCEETTRHGTTTAALRAWTETVNGGGAGHLRRSASRGGQPAPAQNGGAPAAGRVARVERRTRETEILLQLTSTGAARRRSTRRSRSSTTCWRRPASTACSTSA